MTKQLKYLILLLSVMFHSIGLAKTLVFYYKFDQKKPEAILRSFVYSQVANNKELLAKAKTNFFKLNNEAIKSPPAIGTKVKLKLDSRYLDPIKLKSYYLKELGGEYYTEDLYYDEMTYSNRAKSYENLLKFEIQYSYLPYYAVSEKSPNSAKNTLNSLFGLKFNVEYLLRDITIPLYFYGQVSYMQLSNGNGYAQTTPEKRKTFSFSPEIGAIFGFGNNFKKQNSSVYLFFEKSKEFNIDFITIDDQSYVRETDFFFLGVGGIWNRVESEKLDISVRGHLAYSINSNDTLIESQRAVSQSDNAFKFMISPKAKFKNGITLSHQLDGTIVSGQRKATYYRNALMVGKEF